MHYQKYMVSLLTLLGLAFSPFVGLFIHARADTPPPTRSMINPPPAITSITRVSIDSSGAQATADSWLSAVSGDGRYVVFQSIASNLVSGDTNNAYDIFLRDTQSEVTTCISVDTSGYPGNGDSYSLYPASISDDGRYVAFESKSSNLVPGDVNGAADIFVRDTQTGTTSLVSVDSEGHQGIFWSEAPAISADGRYVAFGSYASNLVSGDTNSAADVFLHDRQTGTTTLVSVDSSGLQGNDGSDFPSISADGRYIAFYSMTSNLVSEDTNERIDIFLRDMLAGTTTRVSIGSNNEQGNQDAGYFPPSISADGRYVAFDSFASNLVNGDTNFAWDIFLRDTQTGTTTRLSVNSSGVQGDQGGTSPSISADGRYVTFGSPSTNLVNGDTNGHYDVFIRDTQTGTTARLSVNSGGEEGDGDSAIPAISADGHFVTFYSLAANLVSEDTNGKFDVFLTPVSVGPVYRGYLPMVVH